MQVLYLDDGTQVASSFIDGGGEAWGPMRLGMGDAVKAYDLGLKGMCVGERRKIIAEPHLAYGDVGFTDDEGKQLVPPGATLTFFVTLASMKKPPRVKHLKIDVLKRLECTERTVEGSTIRVHYDGSLYATGKRFETSHGNKPWGPFTLGAKMAIQGYEQGLLDMCVGEKRLLTVPPELAYGEHGSGPIPPNAALKFEVDLVSLEGDDLRVTRLPPNCQLLTEKYDTVVFKYSVKSKYGSQAYAFKQRSLRLSDNSAGDLYERLFYEMCQGEVRKLTVAPHKPLLGFESLVDYPKWETTIWEVTLLRLQKDVLEITNVKDTQCDIPTQIGDSVGIEFNASLPGGGVAFSSLDVSRNPPGSYNFTIGEGDAVQGLEDSVLNMCVGDIRRLVIPSRLAYGNEGLYDSIPPNSTVIFDVLLLRTGFEINEWPRFGL